MKKAVVVGLVVVVLLVVAPVVLAQGGGGEVGEGQPPDLLEVISPHLQALLEAVLVAVVPYIAYHVKQWLSEAKRQAQQVLTREQYLLAEIVVANLVHAAEQIYEAGQGHQKKLYVIQRAEEALARYGLDLDMQQLEAMIESMVRQQLKVPEQARGL